MGGGISKGVSSKMDVQAPHLVTVVDGGDDLSEEAPGLALAQAPPLADVVVQLALAGVLHHDHDLVLVLEHWGENTGRSFSRPSTECV